MSTTTRAAYGAHPYPEGQWTTGLFGCFEDPENCLMTSCLPCVTFGQNAEVIDKGITSCACAGLTYYGLALIGCACLYTYIYRSKLRGLFNLPEDPFNDCCVHYCCSPCAFCQEYRELKNRGLDPSLGWAGKNENMMNNFNQVPPNIASGMTR